MSEMEQQTNLTDVEQTKALERLEVLHPFLEQGVPLKDIALHTHVPLRTLQRWLAQYYRDGIVGLTRKPRADRGKQRSISSELRHEIEKLVERKLQPTAAFVHRRIIKIAKQRGLQPPSYRSVAAIMRALAQKQATESVGDELSSNECRYVQSFTSTIRPNELWQTAHTQLDFWSYSGRKQRTRPWLTIIMDEYSRAIAGFFISYQAPSVGTTALALRQAIWPKADPSWFVQGIPNQLSIDHAAVFVTDDLKQISTDLDIQLLFSNNMSDQSPLSIEYFIRKIVPSFVQTCQEQRLSPEPSLRLTLLEMHFSELLTTYHNQSHPETGVSPQQRWHAGGFTPRLPTSLEQLNPLLLKVPKPRLVHPHGIHLRGLVYADPILEDYVGESVSIRYNPRDATQIWVYHQNKLICHAKLRKILKWDTYLIKDYYAEVLQLPLRHVF